MKRISVAVALLILALAAAAPAAQAEDFCVGVSAPRCPVSGFGPATPTIAGLFDAIDAADAQVGADSVVIAPGTMAFETGFDMRPSSDTEIVGAGVGQTIFQSDSASPSAVRFWFPGGGNGVVRGISVNVVGESPGGNGLSIKNGTVSDFSVTKSNDPFSAGFVGLDLVEDASAHDGTVEVNSNAAIGMRVGSGVSEVHHLEVESQPFLGTTVGVQSATVGSNVNFHDVRISRFTTAIGVSAGHFTLTDSVIDLGTSSGNTGVGADAAAGVAIDLDIARVTVVGDGISQYGFYFNGYGDGSSIDIDLFDFVAVSQIATFSTIYCTGYVGPTQPVTLEVERFAAVGGTWTIDPGCGWDFESDKYVELLDQSPGFVDSDAGDYRLLRTSPLIDAGGTTGSIASGAKDFVDGNRVVDGNGDGSGLVDIGAFEYQRSAPQVTLTQSATTASPGQPVTFQASANDPEGEAFTYAWTFEDGTTAGNVASVERSFSGSGAKSVTVTATDEAGAAGSATAVVMLSAPPAARIVAKPKKAFKRGRSGFSIAKNGAPSFSVRFTGAAKARFTLRSIGKSKDLKGRQDLIVKKDGVVKIAFGGKWNKKKLPVGRYRLTITPVAASGIAGKPLAVDLKLR